MAIVFLSYTPGSPAILARRERHVRANVGAFLRNAVVWWGGYRWDGDYDRFGATANARRRLGAYRQAIVRVWARDCRQLAPIGPCHHGPRFWRIGQHK